MVRFQDILTQGLVIGMSLALLIHLVLIAMYKEMIIKEPVVPILILEIIMMVSIMAFGIYNVVLLLKGG